MHKLYKQNKLTSPDQSKTWLHLLRKPSQTYVDIPYNTSSTENVNKDTENINDELVKTLVSILIEPSIATVVLLDSCLVRRKN